MPKKRKSTEPPLAAGSDSLKDKRVKMVLASSQGNVAATVSTAINNVVGGITAKLPARAKPNKSGAKAQRSKPSGFVLYMFSNGSD